MTNHNRPIIGITMGDAAGVGPEIIVKALADPAVYDFCRPVVIGDSNMLLRAKEIANVDLPVVLLSDVSADDEIPFGAIRCLSLNLLPADLPFGRVSAKAGNAAFRFLERAIDLAMHKRIDAICTAPLNKEALHKAGHMYPGHTEILADLTGAADVAMMLAAPKLRVIHVTTHVGLLDAVRLITPERVFKVIRMAYDTLRTAGFANPRIAVCGINPHAGENGLFGYGEEEQKIVPAVTRARAADIDAVGPLPADTLFYRAVRGDFDIVVAMYHDQGHAPIKVLGMEAGVNISVGLPIIRTSVDHGTAFDIAGTGQADESSLKEAIRQAAELTGGNYT